MQRNGNAPRPQHLETAPQAERLSLSALHPRKGQRDAPKPRRKPKRKPTERPERAERPPKGNRLVSRQPQGCKGNKQRTKKPSYTADSDRRATTQKGNHSQTRKEGRQPQQAPQYLKGGASARAPPKREHLPHRLRQRQSHWQRPTTGRQRQKDGEKVSGTSQGAKAPETARTAEKVKAESRKATKTETENRPPCI